MLGESSEEIRSKQYTGGVIVRKIMANNNLRHGGNMNNFQYLLEDTDVIKTTMANNNLKLKA